MNTTLEQETVEELRNRIKELEQEKEELLARLRLSEAYRFCNNPSVIYKS